MKSLEALDRAVEESSKLIIRELDRINSGTISKLRQKSPETTLNVELLWGSINYLSMEDPHELDMSYPLYLKALMMEFIYKEAGLELQEEIFLNHEEELKGKDYYRFWNQYVGGVGTRSGGSLSLDRKELWLTYIPEQEEERIKEDLMQKLDGSRFKFLGSFPGWLNSKSPVEERSFERYLSSVAHELTHFYVAKNTSVRDKMFEAISRGEKREVEQVLNNDFLLAIDEIFAHLVEDVVMEGVEVNSAYPKNEYIEWGLKIAREKSREVQGSRIDWARKTAALTIREIEDRGQIQNSGERRNPMIYFLKHCLPAEDKKRMERFREISENELSQAFKHAKKAINDLEKEEIGDKSSLRQLKEIERSVDWENPRHIEDEILHRTLSDAVGNYDLRQLHQRIISDLEKEIENLKQVAKIIKRLEVEASGKTSEELEGASKEIRKVEEELEELG